MTNLFEIGKNKYNTDKYSDIVCKLLDDYLSNNSLFALTDIIETTHLIKRLVADNILFPLAVSDFDNWVFLFNTKINNFVDEYLKDLITYKYQFVKPDKIGVRKNVHTETEKKTGEITTEDTSENTGNVTQNETANNENNSISYKSDYPNQNITKENIKAYASVSEFDDNTTSGTRNTQNTSKTDITNNGKRNEEITTERERNETYEDLTPIQVYNDLLVKMQTIYPIFKNEMTILWIKEF